MDETDMLISDIIFWGSLLLAVILWFIYHNEVMRAIFLGIWIGALLHQLQHIIRKEVI